MSGTMRAWRIHEYGGADKLRLEEAPIPSPVEGELLVKVGIASTNPIDWKMRAGYLRNVYPMRFPRILGRDCTGVVAESRSSAFKPGERVLAVADNARGQGTQSEYAVVPATQAARIPPEVDDAEAAAFAIAGVSAWIPLVEIGRIGPGMRVLVHAGAGGVGSVGVQLAHHLGAEVVSTCGSANVAHVSSLGAERVIDYTREDFVAAAGPCDVVFDTVGGETHLRSQLAVKPGGLLTWINASPVPPGGVPREDIRRVPAQINPTTDRMAKLLELAARRILRGQVFKVFAFEEARAAYELVQTGHARGKVLIRVG
ncbi:MAG: NADP-dependent oxidoreductase [Burkholderiales bacterium]|nr:NADP-dependent oxidoreductase [Burkholderiales bacterium]